MKILQVILIASILFLLNVHLASSQWVRTNGPCGGGGTIYSIIVKDSYVFVGSDAGIFRSVLNDTMWSQVSSGLPNSPVTALAKRGNVLFAGTQSSGVYISTNDGASWTPPADPLPFLNGYTVSALVVSDSVLLVSSMYGGGFLYLSTDTGTTWTQPNSTIHAFSFAAQGSNIYAANNLQYGLYHSTDYGLTWNQINPSLVGVYSVAAYNSYVFAGSTNHVSRSTDGGITWSLNDSVFNSTRVNTISVIENGSENNFILAGTDSGLFRSDDMGVSWSLVSSFPKTKYVCAIANNSNKYGTTPHIFAGTVGGIFRSTDNATTWKLNGLPIGNWFLASDGSILLSGMGYYGTTPFTGRPAAFSAIYRTTDDGMTWTETQPGFVKTNTVLRSLAINTNGKGSFNYFAGTRNLNTSFEGSFFLSTDNGLTWIVPDSAFNDRSAVSIAVNNSNIFASIAEGIYRSADYGITWTKINSNVTDLAANTFAYSGNNLFAGTGYRTITGGRPPIIKNVNDVFLSSDNGDTWTKIDSQITAQYLLTSLAANGSDLVVGAGFYSPTPGGTPLIGGTYHIIYNGTNWIVVDSGLIGNYVFSIINSNSYFFAGTSNGIFASPDNGTSWTAINSGLTDTSVSSLVISGTYLFAGTASGVWRRPLSEITFTNEPPPSSPKEFSLFQNYPNPFNPTTVIKYQLPASDYATLKVYDLLGREIANLVDEYKKAGYYNVRFDGNGLTSGMYFYRLTTKSFTITKSMILLK